MFFGQSFDTVPGMQYEIETTFACAHFYKLKEWSDEKNSAFFGKCFSAEEHGHGHDYRLQVQFQIGDLTLNESLRQSLQSSLQELRHELDHRHLNFDIPGLQDKVPTTENIAQYCFQQLQSKVKLPFQLKLFETPDLWVEIYE